jgi:phosphoenolpyruvate-protein phosphotransferase/dihydroxyacetone kinase phosphotransfer subunit
VVGIVVVAHSRALARAAVALAEEMLQGRAVPIVIAAGLDEETFGTDAAQIAEALVEADQDGDGVVVLMDLGSAVLSAEMAVDLLEDDRARERVLLCPAPLVEGLVVAAVTALSGADRAKVAAEAVAALAGKQSQLGPGPVAPPSVIPPVTPSVTPSVPPSVTPSVAPSVTPSADQADRGAAGADTVSGRFQITPEHGLHARPAARLVQALQGIDARVELRNVSTGSDWVPGSSLSRLATLGALRGHDVEVRASGRQAPDAVDRLLTLARRNFDEHPPSRDSTTAGRPRAGQGPEAGGNGTLGLGDGPFPVSPGIGIGPARRAAANGSAPLDELDGPPADGTQIDGTQIDGTEIDGTQIDGPEIDGPEINGTEIDGTGIDGTGIDGSHGGSDQVPEDPATARRHLDSAIDAVRRQVRQIRVRVARDVGEGEAAIFDAHLALLADPDLLESARSRIGAGQAASSAWANAVAVAAAGYESLPDPYLQARAADVRALGNQVSRHLLGRPDHGNRPDQPSGVLVAADLTPTEAATLDPDRVTAVVLAFGSPSTHSAILIRARGIPAVVGAGAAMLEISDGTPLAVDGTTGEVVVNPSDEVVTRFRQRAEAAQDRQRQALARAGAPAATRDGVKILVGANLGSIQDARAATVSGADLAGLVRTEFLFLGRSQAPDVLEQEDVYRAVAEALAGRRITLRTLDVGGDKPLEYLPQLIEANPFLGVRGIRLGLQRPELLADQLLAMVRVAHDVPVSVMFPMVSTVDEVIRARRILADAIRREGRGEPAGLQVGVMVEVPAAALKAAAFAPHVDFLSIGTNDLTQYTLAAERGNDSIARLADPLDPGVLRLIDATCRGAGPATVAVCGELAADESAVAVLAGLGVRELSVTPRAVPGVKQAVRALTLPDATALAARTLDAPSAAAVRDLLR